MQLSLIWRFDDNGLNLPSSVRSASATNRHMVPEPTEPVLCVVSAAAARVGASHQPAGLQRRRHKVVAGNAASVWHMRETLLWCDCHGRDLLQVITRCQAGFEQLQLVWTKQLPSSLPPC